MNLGKVGRQNAQTSDDGWSVDNSYGLRGQIWIWPSLQMALPKLPDSLQIFFRGYQI